MPNKTQTIVKFQGEQKFSPMNPDCVEEAYNRIKDDINRTPIKTSALLDKWLGHEIIFKVEGFQKGGSFKTRGALNTLLWLKEQNQLPKKVVGFSSGNHAQAVAIAARKLGVEATLFLPSFTSRIKQQAAKSYGAEIILTETRQEAERRAKEMVISDGAYYLPPYDHDKVIAGQGTSAYEAYKDGISPDAVFATCGGGGWLSGTLLATKLLSPKTKVFGAEPLNANDAARSYKSGEIFAFENSPYTIADGARALSVSERTFHYIKQVDGFYEIADEDIIYWTQWLNHVLKVSVEPTSATAMAGAFQWLKTQDKKRQVLVLLSGGNIAPEYQLKIWANDYLEKVPSL